MQHLYTNTHSSRTHSISIKRHIIQMLISRPQHLLMRLLHWTWYWLTWKRPFLIIIFFPVFTGSSPPSPPALVSLIKQYSKYLPASYFNQHKQTFIKRRNLNKFFFYFSVVVSYIYLWFLFLFITSKQTDVLLTAVRPLRPSLQWRGGQPCQPCQTSRLDTWEWGFTPNTSTFCQISLKWNVE